MADMISDDIRGKDHSLAPGDCHTLFSKDRSLILSQILTLPVLQAGLWKIDGLLDLGPSQLSNLTSDCLIKWHYDIV